jgi:DNA polymerase-3 subunit gamma/tau
LFRTLYRKYRPKTFGDVTGQEHITSVLRWQVANNRVGHAYLFCGTRGTGKTTCAKILARAVNCENPADGEPCGTCASCRAIDSGTSTDVIEIDAASNNGVEDVRSIIDEVAYAPAMANRRVYIVDEVHMLSTSAFNALLKTLEEPPEHALFILATTELYKLPATIVSRCQRYDFRRLTIAQLSSRLKYIAEREGIGLTDDAAYLLSKQAEGGMRDAIGLFDLCSANGADVDTARVVELLGAGDYESCVRAAVAVAKKDYSEIFACVAAAEEKSDISAYWSELLSFWRDMLVSKCIPGADRAAEYLELSPERCAALYGAAELYTVPTLSRHCRVLDEALVRMQRSPKSKRVIAEVALVRMADDRLDDSTAALAARISALEDAIAGAPPKTIASSEIRREPVAVDATVQTAPANVPADNVKPSAQPSGTPDNGIPASSKGIAVAAWQDALERIASTDARTGALLDGSEAVYDNASGTLRIGTPLRGMVRMLDTDAVRDAIKRALASCGAPLPDAKIVFIPAQKNEKPDLLDL